MIGIASGRMAAVAGALTTLSVAAAPPVRRLGVEGPARPDHTVRIRPLRMREPNGVSWRALKRARNSGWSPPQPTERAKLRHPWYRKKLFFDALREKLGQG